MEFESRSPPFPPFSPSLHRRYFPLLGVKCLPSATPAELPKQGPFHRPHFSWVYVLRGRAFPTVHHPSLKNSSYDIAFYWLLAHLPPSVTWCLSLLCPSLAASFQGFDLKQTQPSDVFTPKVSVLLTAYWYQCRPFQIPCLHFWFSTACTRFGFQSRSYKVLAV